ncbi:hypothetical protein EVAR_17714_1 [Eumeta japonica]|uniref:CCAAT-binding factor domain-containing protein n=1 Tax=Eumeta variegata TaxID=151549 RepID=A0A4C1UT61_EUMVA|nr:hypothetical protein EVAR_17714_1 [Eumeta japonica]
MKHKRFEENILIDEAYTNYGQEDKNADTKKGQGIASHFAQSLEYDERKKWYHQLPQEPPENKPLTQQKIEELRNEASSALHSDTVAYETKSNKSSSSDQQWAKTLLNKGAIGDRVAAATVLIQDNPLYNLTALRNLINNVKPAKKRDGIVIIDALSELLISELLIPNTKLRTFEQHALSETNEIASGNKQAKRNILKLWYYEDQLKELYGSILKMTSRRELHLSSLLFDVLKTAKPEYLSKKFTWHVSRSNTHGLRLTENVLTVPHHHTAAFRAYVEALNNFAHDSVETNKEKAVSAMSYLLMHHPEREKGEIDTRLMSAILTGVKRAYPFANKERLSEAPQHIDAIHKLVHLSKFNIAIHALALLFQISDASKSTSDRYYTALYRKLTNPEIFNTSHSALLFSLIYKSLKKDNDLNRVTSFVKRLLQLCCSMIPAQACGMLFMISQVLKDGNKKECMKLVWTKKEVKEEPSEQEENDKNGTESISEENDNRSDNSRCNSISEKPNSKEKDNANDENSEMEAEVKRVDLLRGNKQDLLNDDDDDEVYLDLKIDDEGNVKPKKRKKTAAVAGWFHAIVKSEKDEDSRTVKLHSQISHAEENNSETDKVLDKELKAKIEMKKVINMDKVITSYDPLARNPSFAGTAFAAFFELLPLANHFHPTVKLFAEKLLNDQVIHYSGDPLIDFSGVRFLDRFVFKNPKKRADVPDTEDGLKKVKGSHPKFAMRKNYTAKGLRSLPVNSASYLNENATRIPVDEKFLYDFLKERRTALDSDAESDSDDSVTSEDFERYLDSMTKSKAKADSDEELDYLAEVETAKQRQAKAKKQDEEKLASDADDDDEDISDGELEISGDEDEPSGLSGDEEELLLEGSDEEDEIEVSGKKAGKKNKLNIKVKGKDDLSSLFASAEEFSTLLEETATNKKQGSSQAVSNTDNASLKQLAWEDKRDRWIKGYNKKILGNKRTHVVRKNNKNRISNQNTKKMSHTKQNQQSVRIANKKGGKRKGDGIKGSGGKRKK